MSKKIWRKLLPFSRTDHFFVFDKKSLVFFFLRKWVFGSEKYIPTLQRKHSMNLFKKNMAEVDNFFRQINLDLFNFLILFMQIFCFFFFLYFKETSGSAEKIWRKFIRLAEGRSLFFTFHIIHVIICNKRKGFFIFNRRL